MLTIIWYHLGIRLDPILITNYVIERIYKVENLDSSFAEELLWTWKVNLSYQSYGKIKHVFDFKNSKLDLIDTPHFLFYFSVKFGQSKFQLKLFCFYFSKGMRQTPFSLIFFFKFLILTGLLKMILKWIIQIKFYWHPTFFFLSNLVKFTSQWVFLNKSTILTLFRAREV